MPRDVGAPTLCSSFHCDCNGGSHQEGLPGNGVPGPPLQDLSAVVLGDDSSCRDPLLCCAAQAVFCLHGLGSLSLCLFLPCHHCTGLSMLPLPLFSTSSRLPWPFPSPVNVYVASHCVSTCLCHIRSPGQISRHTYPQGSGSATPSLTQPCRRGPLCRINSLWS